MTFKIFFCALLLLLPSHLFAATVDFARTLSLGSRGEDVRELQKFLNKDSDTTIATSGSGSTGNETDYFGQATKRAVIKFQEKYRNDILKPAGLSAGTGFFGSGTRAKVIALKNTTTPIPHAVSSSTAVSKGEVIVMFPSQYSGKAGTMITISGSGFTTTENTIYFGNEHAVVNASSWNGQSITFNVPNIPKGIYSLFVKNARGESNKGQWLVVTDGVTQEPKIDSVTPEHVVRGGTVTVKGSGFNLNDNIVQYGAGVIKNIASSDGSSLVFNVPQNALTASTSHATKVALPMWVYVINENGVSNGKSFDLEL